MTLRSVHGKCYFQVALRLRFRTTFILYIYIYISAIYADDNIPYTYSSNIENALDNLQAALEKMFHWFSTKHLIENSEEYHLLTSSKTHLDIHILNIEILNEEKLRLLGVNLEGRLNFDFHANTLT